MRSVSTPNPHPPPPRWPTRPRTRTTTLKQHPSYLTPPPNRPTQSIMYVSLQVNRSQKCILLIVQYKYIKSCSGDFYSPESDPPFKIMRYWVYYSTQLVFGFPSDRICQVETICIGGVPVLKRHFGWAGPSIFHMIHRGGRCAVDMSHNSFSMPTSSFSTSKSAKLCAGTTWICVKAATATPERLATPSSACSCSFSSFFWFYFSEPFLLVTAAVSWLRHLGSSTAANWVSFDLNVSCSSCWGYSLINTLKFKKNWERLTEDWVRSGP